ncbi:MAG: GTP-binding protein [Erysipelotrichaceae bacterium]|nr:GTP-binding protein [Erysipelotrichaceae bacterium]MCI9523448.1 GTP-binding protein [Erysipelotrichaceae bacterium]
MTKIDIISGFLGAGKTTLIKKLIKEAYGNEKLVLIENEFGEIGIDGSFLQDAGVEIKEMNSGCICCSLVGDFSEALIKVMEQFQPQRILIEPSGVGKLSDVIKAVKNVADTRFVLNSASVVVDGKKAGIYMKNFGEFFNNQVEYAQTIIVSRTQLMRQEQIEQVVHALQEKNPNASIITTPWDALSAAQIINVMEQNHLSDELMKEMDVCPHCHHHHERDQHCDHTHTHGNDSHHHHHHADDVFTSWGIETARLFTKDKISACLQKLSNQNVYGIILRAKGMLRSEDGWLCFDYVPEEFDIRSGQAETIGKLCVIGSSLHEQALEELFGLK